MQLKFYLITQKGRGMEKKKKKSMEITVLAKNCLYTIVHVNLAFAFSLK